MTRFRQALLRSVVPIFASSCLLLSTAPAFSIDAALTLVGSTTGEIQGETVAAGREGTIPVVGYSGAMDTPTGANGFPAGSPQCRPLTIRKPVDRATPLLVNAWNALEPMSTFELRFYRVNSGGASVHYFTIELANAVITTISQAGGEADAVPMEQLSFVFSAAEYTFTDGGISTVYSCGSGGA